MSFDHRIAQRRKPELIRRHKRRSFGARPPEAGHRSYRHNIAPPYLVLNRREREKLQSGLPGGVPVPVIEVHGEVMQVYEAGGRLMGRRSVK
jgi:hypothetical protein